MFTSSLDPFRGHIRRRHERENKTLYDDMNKLDDYSGEKWGVY